MSKQIIIVLSILGAVLAVGAVTIGMSALKRTPQPTSITSTAITLPRGVVKLKLVTAVAFRFR